MHFALICILLASSSNQHTDLSVGVLKLCSLTHFADLQSVLDKREPLQQTSDRKNETEPLGLCQASQFILLPLHCWRELCAQVVFTMLSF